MAAADYRLCDLCEGKTFYDSNLSYQDGTDEWAAAATPYRQRGEEQYSDPAINQKFGNRLGYLGDWAVICEDCAKTHKTVIVPR